MFRKYFSTITKLSNTRVSVSIPVDHKDVMKIDRFYKRVVYPIQMYSSRQSDYTFDRYEYDGQKYVYTFTVKQPENMSDFVQKMEHVLQTLKSSR